MFAHVLLALTLAVPAYVDQQQRELEIPGVAYAIVTRDRVVEQHTSGVTPQTPFLIGSVSKPFTALTVMQLVEQGRVALDDPVGHHLPWFAFPQITVRQLLNHTSGLPQWASRTDRFDNTPDGLNRSVRDLASARLGAHEYSDANYMVLGAMVAEVTGRPFREVLQRQVFGPLDMRHTVAQSAGHRYWFGHPRRFEAPYDLSGLPYGYVTASLQDMTHFAMAHLNGGRYGSAQLLKAATVTQMQTAQTEVGYGLGWRDTTLDGTRIVWHAGAAPGFWAHLVLVPSAGLGVIVLADGYSPALDERLASIAFTITRMALGGAPGPSPGWDPLLRGTLYTLVALAGLLTLTIAISAVRRRARPGAAAFLWVAACALLATLVLLVLPASMGYTLTQIHLWTPDIFWSIVAVATLAKILAVLRVTLAARAARHGSRHHSGPPRRRTPLRPRRSAAPG
ncbi:serine hydrolase domain-containing protein [Actinoplanes sp. NPDC048988]|uniref:serine hydrolase domain-containing protein n=1 Tax=Actinoplanes sp. NPDC048988 TaxID=3363901 RepID=UPI0037191BD2